MLITLLATAAASMTTRADVDIVLRSLRGQSMEAVVAELGRSRYPMQTRDGLTLNYWSAEIVSIQRNLRGGHFDNPTAVVPRFEKKPACVLRITFSSTGALKTWRWKGTKHGCDDLVAEMAGRKADPLTRIRP